MTDPAASRDFGRVLAAEGMSNFGSMLSRLAIPWIAALSLAATPWQMGWLLVADVAAAALGGLLLGGVVDRAGKRGVMVAADLARAALLGAVAWAAWQGVLVFSALLLAAAAAGVLTLVFELARSAWLAQRGSAEALAAQNAKLSAVASLSETAAFALGGWLFQWLGAVVALAVDALSYLASAFALRGVAEVPPVAAAPRPRGLLARLAHDATEGLRAVAAQRSLRALAVLEVLMAMSMSLSATSYMIFVARDIGFATGWLGLIFALGGVGAVAGAAVAPWLGRRLGPGRAIACGLALFALGAACVPLVGAPGVAGALLLVAQQVVGDAGHTVHEVHDRTLRQTLVEPDLLARADAGLRALGQGATLAGALVGGAFAAAIGTRGALAAAALFAATAALFAAMRLGRRPD